MSKLNDNAGYLALTSLFASGIAICICLMPPKPVTVTPNVTTTETAPAVSADVPDITNPPYVPTASDNVDNRLFECKKYLSAVTFVQARCSDDQLRSAHISWGRCNDIYYGWYHEHCD